eukprot:Phypoly_transcript_02973.p1 GENE.Phypoly_transcript_02973~~Phypoly_transcript_02973.p1  ORF type:complete len:858 (+),score=174.41 Phypoly_transcript_02973:24-2597(+)
MLWENLFCNTNMDAGEYLRWIEDANAFVVRLDIRMYKVYAHHFRVPYDSRVATALLLTARDCLINFRESSAIYVFSDEINIVFSDRKSREKETRKAVSILNREYYDLKYVRGDVEAIDLVSYASSFASHKFNLHMRKQSFDENVDPLPIAAANSGKFSFHGSIISLSPEESLKYILKRAKTCIEVSKRSFLRAYDPGADLPPVSSKNGHAQLSKMLKKVRDQQGIDWSTTSTFFRRGILLKRNLCVPSWSFMDIFDEDVGSESQLQFLLVLDARLYLSHYRTRFDPFLDNSLEKQVGEDTLIAGMKIDSEIPAHEHDNDHDKHIRFTKRQIEESPEDTPVRKRRRRIKKPAAKKPETTKTTTTTSTTTPALNDSAVKTSDFKKPATKSDTANNDQTAPLSHGTFSKSSAIPPTPSPSTSSLPPPSASSIPPPSPATTPTTLPSPLPRKSSQPSPQTSPQISPQISPRTSPHTSPQTSHTSPHTLPHTTTPEHTNSPLSFRLSSLYTPASYRVTPLTSVPPTNPNHYPPRDSQSTPSHTTSHATTHTHTTHTTTHTSTHTTPSHTPSLFSAKKGKESTTGPLPKNNVSTKSYTKEPSRNKHMQLQFTTTVKDKIGQTTNTQNDTQAYFTTTEYDKVQFSKANLHTTNTIPLFSPTKAQTENTDAEETCDVDMLDLDTRSSGTSKSGAKSGANDQNLMCEEHLTPSGSSAKSGDAQLRGNDRTPRTKLETARGWKLADLDDFLSDGESTVFDNSTRVQTTSTDKETDDVLVPDSQPAAAHNIVPGYFSDSEDYEPTQEVTPSPTPTDVHSYSTSPPYPFVLPPHPANVPRNPPSSLSSISRNSTTEEVELKRKNLQKRK